MRYNVVEDPRVQRKVRSMFVRDRARYLEIMNALRESPYPGDDVRVSQLDFDDGLSIFAYNTPALRYMVIYFIREPDAEETTGEVRIISLIDRAQRSLNS